MDENPDIAECKKITQSIFDSFASGDLDYIVSMYTQDCVYLPNGAPIKYGHDGMKSVLEGFKMAGNMEFKNIKTKFYQLADNVIVSNTSSQVYWPDTGECRNGKDVVVWKKEDGKWKVFQDCPNYDHS